MHVGRMIDTVARLNAALQGRYAIGRELSEGGIAQELKRLVPN